MTLESDLNTLRNRAVKNVAQAAADLMPELKAGMDAALRRIKAAGYDPKVVRAEMMQLTDAHSSRTAQAVLSEVQAAALMADEYEAIVTTHISKGAMGASAAVGASSARTVVARAIVANTPVEPVKPTTDPQKRAAANIRRLDESKPLSARLHASAVTHQREIVQHSVRAATEQRALGDAGKRLIAQVERKGVDLGAGQTVPKLLQRLANAAKGVAHEAGPVAEREMAQALKAAERYTQGLATHSRTFTAWRESIDRIVKHGAKGVDDALGRWGIEKQRYNAERILTTETFAAYRSEQYLRDQDSPWIVGYIWRMNTSGRKGFVKRVKPTRGFPLPGQPKKSAKRGRCICELLNGKRFEKTAPAEYPRGGHPFCMCWFEPVLERKVVFRDATDADRAKWG